MAAAAERAADIAGERPYVGTLAAFGLEHGVIGVRAFGQLQPVDRHLARLKLHGFAVAGEIVGALAVERTVKR